MWRELLVSVLVFSLFVKNAASEPEEPCDSNIYCYGRLLHTVQMSGIYKDNKNFVDRPLKFLPHEVHQNFTRFMKAHAYKPEKEDIRKFVRANFHPNGHELLNWAPADWKPNPKFLNKIQNPKYQAFGVRLNNLWNQLGRKIKPDAKLHPEKHSIIYVSKPFIVPGGRFREYYYWDSFWIQKGLLVSEMYGTVKGMLQNFLELVNTLGYVPNGGRIYMRRSQPPLLIPMMKSYLDATGDLDFVQENLVTLEKEFAFWMENRMIDVKVAGKTYRLARYDSEKKAPRPEAYSIDYILASNCNSNAEKHELYFNMHSTAESGWDFSSRWFITPENQTASRFYTKTRDILPVDLNSILYLNAALLSELYAKVNNHTQALLYEEVAKKLKEAVKAVFWNDTLGSWFDYDLVNERTRTEFMAAAILPIWAGIDRSSEIVQRTVDYLRSVKALEYPAGVPATLKVTGEQWDFPNGWAPLQHLVIDALERFGDSAIRELAFQLAEKWVLTNYKAYADSHPNAMFEKYNVTAIGAPGGGGEYGVVAGFGWSNGVILDLLDRFGHRLLSSKKKRGVLLKTLLSISNNSPFSLIYLEK